MKLLPIALAALLVPVSQMHAQWPPTISERSLPISLFERYLELARQQAGVPGLSAAILQNDRLVWDRGFGYQDVDALISATADTPYPLLDLSQALAATVLLQQCFDLRSLELSDRVRRWYPRFSEEGTTVAQLLSHSGTEGFRYDTGRYASVGALIEECAGAPYPLLLSREVFDRLGMADSVPGHDLAESSAANRRYFSQRTLDRYAALLGRVAVPYRVDSRGRPSRSDYSRPSLSASTGVVSTVRDLARFDAAIGVLLESGTRDRAWQGGSGPMGLGWFVQQYNGQRIVWHYGLARDAYSALYITVPGRNLTLIMLGNSDGLAAPYRLSEGNLTSSVFAQLFLQLFVS